MERADEPKARSGERWHGEFAGRVLVAVTITLGVVGLALLSWFAADILLIAFAGALVAVGLRGVAERVGRRMRLQPRPALLVTVLVILFASTVTLRYLAPRVVAEVDALLRVLPSSLRQISEWLEDSGWGGGVMSELDASSLVDRAFALLWRATGAVSRVLLGLGMALLIFAIGVYGAVSPDLYVKGFVRLFPKARQRRAREVVAAVGHTMRWWLLARVVAMLVVGVLSGLGLWVVGVPLPLALGLIAGASSFIPNIGFFLAGLLILLFAASEGAGAVLKASAVYLVVQGLEGYLITPLVEHRAVHIPPALNMTAQLLMALLFGFLGLMFAAPLVAVILVVVRMVYVEGLLGQHEVATEDEHQGRPKGDGASAAPSAPRARH